MNKLLVPVSVRRSGKVRVRRRPPAVHAWRFERLEDRRLLAAVVAAAIPAVPTGALVSVAPGPTSIALSQSSVPIDSAVGTTVGSFTAVDDQAGPYTFQLVPGAGSTNNADFAIAGNLLKTNVVVAGPAVYSIRVQATDPGGLSLDEVFSIAAIPGPLPVAVSSGLPLATVAVSLPGPAIPPWALTPAPSATTATVSTVTNPAGQPFSNSALFGTTLPGVDGAGGLVINPPTNQSPPDSNKGNTPAAEQRQADLVWPAAVDSIAASAAFPMAQGQSSAPLNARALDAVMAEYADAAIFLLC